MCKRLFDSFLCIFFMFSAALDLAPLSSKTSRALILTLYISAFGLYKFFALFYTVPAIVFWTLASGLIWLSCSKCLLIEASSLETNMKVGFSISDFSSELSDDLLRPSSFLSSVVTKVAPDYLLEVIIGSLSWQGKLSGFLCLFLAVIGCDSATVK